MFVQLGVIKLKSSNCISIIFKLKIEKLYSMIVNHTNDVAQDYMVILSWLTWSIQMQSRARQIFFITIILSPSTNLFHSIVRREWEGQFVIKMSILPELIISNHSKQAAPPTAVGNNSELTQSLQRLFILRFKM